VTAPAELLQELCRDLWKVRCAVPVQARSPRAARYHGPACRQRSRCARLGADLSRTALLACPVARRPSHGTSHEAVDCDLAGTWRMVAEAADHHPVAVGGPRNRPDQQRVHTNASVIARLQGVLAERDRPPPGCRVGCHRVLGCPGVGALSRNVLCPAAVVSAVERAVAGRPGAGGVRPVPVPVGPMPPLGRVVD